MGLSRALIGTCVATLCGCAPTLPKLLADRHYEEALAYAARTSAADQERVADAILRDLRPQIHVAVGQLPATDGRAPAVSLLRLRVATNAVPLTSDFFSVASSGSALVVASLDTLAPQLGESYLGCVDIKPGAVATVMDGIVSAVTLGAVNPGFSRPYSVCASDEKQRQAAPLSTAIVSELKRGCTRQPDHTDLRCTYDFLMPGSVAVPRITTEPVALLFRFRFAVSLPGSSKLRQSTTFATERQYELVIPAGLPADNAQPLGKTFRPLLEVAPRR